MTVTVRPFRWRDIPALVEVVNRALEVDGGTRVTEERLRYLFRAPDLLPEENCVVAVATATRLAGFCMAAFENNDKQVWLRGNVHPDYRRQGVGGRLLRTAEARVRYYRVGAPTCAWVYTHDQNAGKVALVEAEGYQPVRAVHTMHIDLTGSIAAPAPPPGLTIGPFDRAQHARAVYAANQEAFEGQWGHTDEPFEPWAHALFEDPRYDPGLWVIAFDGGEIAGYCVGMPAGERRTDTGWIEVLGVRPAWRRRGLGSALLRHSFGLFQARGYTAVELVVDAENVTHAAGLYERAGMHVRRRDLIYEKILMDTYYPQDW